MTKEQLKRDFILGCDYSSYPKPLKDLLEKRQEVYRTCYDSYTDEDFNQLVESINNKIKLILTIW